MLRTIRVDLLIIDQRLNGGDNISDIVGNNKVDRVKVGAKIAISKSQNKIKGKNLVKSFSTRLQASTQSFGLAFVTLKAR